MDTLLRQISKVDDLLRLPALNTLAAEAGTSAVTEAVRRTLDRLRADILVGTVTELPSTEALCAQISASCRASRLPSLRGVINATGIVLHTNLGRACLSDRALAAAREVSQGYSTLEYDLTAGERGQRYGSGYFTLYGRWIDGARHFAFVGKMVEDAVEHDGGKVSVRRCGSFPSAACEQQRKQKVDPAAQQQYHDKHEKHCAAY